MHKLFETNQNDKDLNIDSGPLTYGHIISLTPIDKTNYFLNCDGFVKNICCLKDLS